MRTVPHLPVNAVMGAIMATVKTVIASRAAQAIVFLGAVAAASACILPGRPLYPIKNEQGRLIGMAIMRSEHTLAIHGCLLGCVVILIMYRIILRERAVAQTRHIFIPIGVGILMSMMM